MGVRATPWNRVWLQVGEKRVVLDRIFRIKEGFRWHLIRLNLSLQIQWVAFNRVGDWGSSGRIPGINKIMRVRWNQTQTTVHVTGLILYRITFFQLSEEKRTCEEYVDEGGCSARSKESPVASVSSVKQEPEWNKAFAVAVKGAERGPGLPGKPTWPSGW